jgi:hypothetical protein
VLLFQPPLAAAATVALAIAALVGFGWYRTRKHAAVSGRSPALP